MSDRRPPDSLPEGIKPDPTQQDRARLVAEGLSVLPKMPAVGRSRRPGSLHMDLDVVVTGRLRGTSPTARASSRTGIGQSQFVSHGLGSRGAFRHLAGFPHVLITAREGCSPEVLPKGQVKRRRSGSGLPPPRQTGRRSRLTGV